MRVYGVGSILLLSADLLSIYHVRVVALRNHVRWQNVPSVTRRRHATASSVHWAKLSSLVLVEAHCHIRVTMISDAAHASVGVVVHLEDLLLLRSQVLVTASVLPVHDGEPHRARNEYIVVLIASTSDVRRLDLSLV